MFVIIALRDFGNPFADLIPIHLYHKKLVNVLPGINAVLRT